jgi:GNAT superfamily N-acetyltransferase
MCDEWMPILRLPLTLAHYQQLPQHPAYKYEYSDGQLLLTPRAKFYHARLDLEAFRRRAMPLPEPEIRLRPARADELPDLAEPFAAAFRRQQPFASLDAAARHEAARACLQRTRSGGDGPLIEQASFVVQEENQGGPVGAILVTLLPPGDPCDFDTYYWSAPPPPDCIARRLGQPHLTWVFVTPIVAGQGIGTALLAAAVRELLSLGFTELLTTFLLGNDSSMLWHWRNGFAVLPHPSSVRRLRQRWRQGKA